MDPTYFETWFTTPCGHEDWPTRFATITGHATTGEAWTAAENEAANRRLEAELERRGIWHRPLTGYSPRTAHTEPGWAVAMTFNEACDLGVLFLQDAIYYVDGDELFVSHCDARRGLVPVGRFRERLTPPPQLAETGKPPLS